MNLELLLRIFVAATSAVGTALMGIGERDPTRPLAAVVVAAVAVYVVDYKKWFRFHPWVANIAGFTAVVASLREATGFSFYSFRDEWLLAVAHLLTYLQFVMLLQEKNQRVYWLLLTLSLLQTAVASALSLELWFGMLLLLYLALVLATLSVFFLFREQQAFETTESTVKARTPRGDWVRPRWPLGTRAAFVRSHVQFEPDYGRATFSFVRRIGLMAAFTLGIGATLFYLTPRTNPGTGGMWSQPTGAGVLRQTGFAQEVDINDMGDMLESRAKVLQLQFLDPLSNQSVRVDGDPLLRGAVLVDYRDGRWQRSSMIPSQLRPLDHAPPWGVDLMRQVIDLEPHDTEVLFTTAPYSDLYPVVGTAPREDILFDTATLALERSGSKRRRKFRYEFFTWGVQNNRMVDRYPQYGVFGDPFTGRTMLRPDELHPRFFHRLTLTPMHDGQPSLKQLQALTNRVAPGPAYQPPYMMGGGLDFDRQHPRDVEARCRRLERYLREDGGFRYSLKARAVDPTLDPVEDFVLNRKSGHCEYYATALTLMLRMKGIPARMISGFKGAEWNDVGEFYLVRQLHAHTWVEAYLPPDPEDPLRGGQWLIMDATPEADREELINPSTHPAMAKLREYNEYAQFLWTTYVVGMDSERQHKVVYEPLRNAAKAAAQWLFDREAWRSMFEGFWNRLVQRDLSYFEGNWFSWRGGLATIALLWTLVGATRAARWGLRRFLRFTRTDQRGDETGQAAQVAFFRAFEEILARSRMVRGRGQTPREFALDVGGRLADRPEWQSAASTPRRVVEVFYRVRFGGAVLDKTELLAVEQAVQDLAAVLEPPAKP